MSFTTLQYLLFILAGLIIYYIIPKKFQWIWLLLMSYGYYLTFGKKTIVLLLATTLIVYLGGRVLDKIISDSDSYMAANKANMDKDQKKAFKAKVKKNKRRVVAIVLVLSFGILAAVKYLNFIIENIDNLVLAIGHGQYIEPIAILLPLGISFYTFQAASYIIDIYQGKYKAERNPFKFALFVTFFPQLLQGPIGRFDKLGHQLFEGHKFELKNLEFGAQRILWGLFKKVVLADRSAVIVYEVFNNYQNYGGFFNILALLMYSIQLYADFSGGIDIVIGTAEMFGIKMDENFRQPYFSKSIGEFWRRWHISLGAWMKDYIFYPYSLSKHTSKMGKWIKKHWGAYLGKTLPICLANVLIFFIVGIWHGAAWKYIAYGLYNGFIIAIAALLEPWFKKALAGLHINAEGKAWNVFRIIRTFILVNIGWYFDMAPSFGAAMTMMKETITRFSLSQMSWDVIAPLGLGKSDYWILLFGCMIVFIISCLKEKGVNIRESLSGKNIAVRWVTYYGLILLILFVGFIGATQGFIYAQF